MLVRKVAKNAADILKIKRFLYHCYVHDLKWIPAKDNVSQWHVVNPTDSLPIFADFYDSHATWIAVYDDEDLVASCRIIKPKEKRLEFELYQHISNLIPLRMPRVELNRFAVKSEYIHGRAVIELFLEVLEHCLDEKIATLFISAPAAMVPICLNLGFTETKSQEFRYFPSDPQPSRILCLDFTDRDRIEGIHRRCRNIS